MARLYLIARGDGSTTNGVGTISVANAGVGATQLATSSVALTNLSFSPLTLIATETNSGAQTTTFSSLANLHYVVILGECQTAGNNDDIYVTVNGLTSGYSNQTIITTNATLSTSGTGTNDIAQWKIKLGVASDVANQPTHIKIVIQAHKATSGLSPTATIEATVMVKRSGDHPKQYHTCGVLNLATQTDITSVAISTSADTFTANSHFELYGC